MSQCKGCAKKILWGVTAGGVKVPLDPRPPVYILGEYDVKTDSYAIERAADVAVSHFSTCPEASHFSKRRKVDAAS